MPMPRYLLQYYEMINGWESAPDKLDTRLSDDLDRLKKLRDSLNNNLPEANKVCGEHWGVIDLDSGLEVDCPLPKHYLADILSDSEDSIRRSHFERLHR